MLFPRLRLEKVATAGQQWHNFKVKAQPLAAEQSVELKKKLMNIEH